LDHGFDFIMSCKPDSHQALYEEVTALTATGAVAEVTERVWTGRGHERRTYRYVDQVPLRADAQTLMVNWCEITVVSETTGKVLYHNAFATNRTPTEQTVQHIVVAGRTRWKIENENNNVLKNQGYHLEHNYGHGNQYLSNILVTLILLAFLCHTVLQLADSKYQRVRARLATRKTFFDDIRALTRYMFFESWERLLDFMLAGLQQSPG
jgi:SRSO17 transposase